jgi:hypothetical protein
MLPVSVHVVDGRSQQSANKHAIVGYGASMAGIPSQIGYGGHKKICHGSVMAAM